MKWWSLTRCIFWQESFCSNDVSEAEGCKRHGVDCDLLSVPWCVARIICIQKGQRASVEVDNPWSLRWNLCQSEVHKYLQKRITKKQSALLARSVQTDQHSSANDSGYHSQQNGDHSWVLAIEKLNRRIFDNCDISGTYGSVCIPAHQNSGETSYSASRSLQD